MMKKIFYLTLSLFAVIACENEPVGMPTYEEVEIVEKNSELSSYLERIATAEDPNEETISCIKFNYPLVLYLFDSNQDYVSSNYISNGTEFSDFLNSIPANLQMGINYPLMTTDSSGNTIEIQNNQDLQESIETCANEELVIACKEYLTGSGDGDEYDKCYWEIISYTNHQEFEGALLSLSPTGRLSFFHDNVKYDGSWIAHSDISEDNLYTNIFLQNNGELDFLNKDWQVLSGFNECCNFTITDGTNTIFMERNCIMDCMNYEIEVCIDDLQQPIEVSLKDYLPCMFSVNSEEFLDPIQFNFYETEDWATTQTDSLSIENYTLISNPQTLYLNRKSFYTGTNIDDSEITIQGTTDCD